MEIRTNHLFERKEMTKERKEELRQLLEEAMDGLQIGVRLGGSSLLVSPTTGRAGGATEVYIRRGSLQIHTWR